MLEYLGDAQLREHITATTNKVEAYNGFAKWLNFGGEGVIDNSNYTLVPVSEIGVQATHGVTPEPSPVKNPVAIQFGGLGADVVIYRK